MFSTHAKSEYGISVRRKRTISFTIGAVFILLALGAASVFFIGVRKQISSEREELLGLWEEGSYETAYAVSRDKLIAKPMDFFLLTMYGFSSYQLAVAQINDYDTKSYIDECIWSLRKALLCREGPGDLRISYVLGKAYYAKGPGYEDLAVSFLESARDGGYEARDLPEYLGLAYAAVRDYRSSVAAFSLALSENNSDLLLLSIARSYIALEETETAAAYLARCVESSRDSNTIITARLLLGEISAKSGDVSGAETQYLAILEENGENAEAHFQLGELYDAAGDGTRARAEWRRAIRINPAHRSARARLNM
ncbi:MAG: tetratricopeptide repeat protein [Treponema sp.]|nr:tetratricopeptide repeat protein [Treponema sp.]